MLQLKEYQQRSLDTLSEFFRLTCQHGPKMAFMWITDRPYRSVPVLGDVPYICLRVPTGGGKTLMASYCLGTASREYLQTEHAVCLWLVPSNTIREQTLAALKDRQHPYRQALDAHFAGNVRVMDLQEALYVQRGVLDGETVIIVSTLAASRVEDTEVRKVYETAGALQHHFTGLDPALLDALEKDEDGLIPYSLANVLRLRRPVVIMDEAHNARTELSFDTLARFNPSCIMEFTATPVTEHKPERGVFASNVLLQVSAWELKQAEMIKLPIKLYRHDDWKEVMAAALQQQRELEDVAVEERRKTGEYIRPLVLLQAQPNRKDQHTLNVDTVKQTLVADFNIPEEQIAIATGDTRELDDVDVFDPQCPIRFIITIQALREGWDCSFAYVLCSVAEQHSARSVEQILGRILRMPRASRKSRPELNCAYAFVASRNFDETAKSLQDGLVENGFERIEAERMIASFASPNPTLFDQESVNLFTEASETVSQEPQFAALPPEIRGRVEFDQTSKTLTVRGFVSEPQMQRIQDCFTNSVDRETVERICRRLQGRTRVVAVQKKPPFRVPMLSVNVDGVLDFFDDSYFLDYPWHLSECDSQINDSNLSRQAQSGISGVEIDIGANGHVQMRHIDDLHNQMSLLATEPGWTLASLVNWLDRQIFHPDITQEQSSLFIHKALTFLITQRGFTLEQLARRKYRLKNLLEEKISEHRKRQREDAYRRTLFGPEHLDLLVSPECSVVFDEDSYAPSQYYTGGWRWNKHYADRVGELKSEGEEFECARFIDNLTQVKHWIRNLERRPQTSFWLQTATDKFYPDFVAELMDGRYLVLEYKGEDRWSNDDSVEKRALGELWSSRSNGTCLFVMPKGKDFSAVLRVL